MELTFLDARQGDAIWVRWGEGRQLLVDMGTSGTGRALADRFRALPEDQRAFELLVVTHVDTDHIGGVLTGLVDPAEPVPVTFADVWFNGWEHLNGLVPADERSQLEPMGGVQGELLTAWLRDHAWNDAFGRAAAIRTDTTLPRSRAAGRADHHRAGARAGAADRPRPGVAARRRRRAREGDARPTSPRASSRWGRARPRPSRARSTSRSSARTRSRSTGAGPTRRASRCSSSTTASAPCSPATPPPRSCSAGSPCSTRAQRVPLDLVKLPHHGSRNNVSRALVQAVDCPLWVFSSDGTTFRHPDAIAVSRVVRDAGPEPHLVFNVPSTFNQWWERPEWQDLFGYTTTYGVEDDGVTVALS